MEYNALYALAENAETFLADGITDKDPVFDVALMKDFAKEKLKELESLPQFDLSTEGGRKQLMGAIKPLKQMFADFEKNIKVIKVYFSEIPKKCDATSKAVRDICEPAIAKALAPFTELKSQEELTLKWWKKEGIPVDESSLEFLLEETKNAKPLPFSNAGEKADFFKYKEEYIAAIEKSLDRIAKAKQAEKEEKERLAKEAELLRLQREEQAKIAAEQRRKDEELKAQQAKIAAEAAELEAQKKQQAAVNPANAGLNEQVNLQGVPSANLDEKARKAMRREAVAAIEEIARNPYSDEELAFAICKAIYELKIPHVRFVYE